MQTVSFDNKPDYYSFKSGSFVAPRVKNDLRDMIKGSFLYIIRYFAMLSPIDYDIARFYYIEDLSQEQISKLVGISQVSISRRVRFVFNRVKYMLRKPTLNPIQVRDDLKEILPNNLFEFAYCFYWEVIQNRVKDFLKVSQSGAANKFASIIKYLEKNISEVEQLDQNISMEQDRVRCLSLVYLDFFRYISGSSNVLNFLCKKNDMHRMNSLIKGNSIFSI